MNQLEYEMIEVLKKLKDYGCVGLKAEYEAEGSRQVELMRLKDIADAVNLPLIIKIGGVEAITDIYEALSIGAKGIVAPMAETPYAVSKFLNAIEKYIPDDNRKDIEFAINIETITAYYKLDSILSLKNILLLQRITVGRVDFTGSLGLGRDNIERPTMNKHCVDIFKKAREVGLNTTLGGAISTQTLPFINSLLSNRMIDRYETRKVIFTDTATEDKLLKAVEFELLWLKSKRRYYHRIKEEDEKRIQMLEGRL